MDLIISCQISACNLEKFFRMRADFSGEVLGRSKSQALFFPAKPLTAYTLLYILKKDLILCRKLISEA
jgi:hypothetical protein